MKKIIIGALALLTIGIGGIAISNKVVKATNTDDKSKIKLTTTTGEIETFKNSEFEIKLSIDPGFIKFDTKLQPGITLTENILKINKDPLVTLVDATRIDVKSSESTKLIVGERIDLGKIEYVQDPSGYQEVGAEVFDFIGKKFDVILKFRANDTGKIDNILSGSILEYRDRNSNFIKESVDGSVKVDIKEISYTPGEIIGKGINNQLMNDLKYPMNKFFTMKYEINPGTITAVDKAGNNTALNSLNLKENRLIYTIDKSIIDEVGGNDETARESLIKSLQILKDSNPDAKVSLIAFDDKAEVISVEDEEILSIDALISEIEKIESSDKAGNLGEAIRMTQVLINKEENPSSVILVTGENPNYYTQVSEGNKSMLYTRVEKDGVSKEDYETAQEYVNTVVNDIAVNEESKTRWYSVNYNENDEEERIVDEVIRKFEGYSLDIKRPYYGDFERLNEKAISPVILRVEVTAEVGEKDFIEIHEQYKSQILEFIFKKDGNDNLVADAQGIEVLAKIKKVDESNKKIDVAKTQNIKITAKVNGFEDKKIVFNEDGKISWMIEPTISHFIEYGLFNGRFKGIENKFSSQKEITPEDINIMNNVQNISSQILEDVPNPELSIENTFSTGIVIKSKVNGLKVEPVVRKKNNGKSDKDPNGNISETPIIANLYKYDLKTKSFVDPFKKVEGDTTTKEGNETEQTNKGKEFNLNDENIYLITIDYYIDGKSGSQKVNDNFEIGLKVGEEFWGIDVNVVDKPEHF